MSATVGNDELFQAAKVSRLERISHGCGSRKLVSLNGAIKDVLGFPGEDFDLALRLDQGLECGALVNQDIVPRADRYLTVGGACECSAERCDKRTACPSQAGARSGGVGSRLEPGRGAA